MAKNVLCLVALVALLLAGCEESAIWVDQPKQSTKCDDEEIEAAEKFPEMSSILGKKVCQGAGKGEFTGEFRCKGESFQVACKAN